MPGSQKTDFEVRSADSPTSEPAATDSAIGARSRLASQIAASPKKAAIGSGRKLAPWSMISESEK